MGMLYRRSKRDPVTRQKVEFGPWWIKFYDNGRPIRESTGTTDKTEARRRLKEKEGKVSEGLYSGPQVERTKFEDLVQGIKQDYALNERKSLRRLNDYITHLSTSFGYMRVRAITTDKITAYIAKRREQGAANGTINRELGCLKRMFKLAHQQTPPKVARLPHIPMLEEHNIRSGFLEHEDFLALRGALPDYAKVAVTLAYYSGMRMGEVYSLEWKQINWTEGKLYLRAQETKTDTPRILYLTGDLLKVLSAWKGRCEKKWPSCPWICHRGGIRLESLKHSWRKGCQCVGLGTMVKDEETGELVWNGPIPHDFRRTAVRNMVRAGIPEKIAMAISGHKTRSVFDRYNIVNETDLVRAAKSLSDYFEREKQGSMGTLAGTLTEKIAPEVQGDDAELVGMSAGGLELARGIEPPTCGLQNVSSPTADNLNQQETTKQDPPDMGLDGASLSCPGSSVVAEEDD
ncbi:MAG: tyrosine-type recombinase/integrase [Nitrospira sp.]|nr:tyrosine-type recombinase/integrase [Nitrospira sp.]